MKDTLLGEILAIVIAGAAMVIALVRVNRNSIRRSIEIAEKTAKHRTEVDLKIIEINKDLIIMKDLREKERLEFLTMMKGIESENKLALIAMNKGNTAEHDLLFKLVREQTGIISTVAAGVARIEGKMEGFGK